MEITPGLRFYISQEGTLEKFHAATIDHEFPSPYGDGGMVWAYVCDCGFVGDVRPENVVQWLVQYGTPPPKPEPLPRLDYTEESLISDLASYPINDGECFMHGFDCSMAEFDCEPRKGYLVYTDIATLRQMVEKARELVKRRRG